MFGNWRLSGLPRTSLSRLNSSNYPHVCSRRDGYSRSLGTQLNAYLARRVFVSSICTYGLKAIWAGVTLADMREFYFTLRHPAQLVRATAGSSREEQARRAYGVLPPGVATMERAGA